MPDDSPNSEKARTTGFLEIEEIALELTQRLSRLDSESERYSAAANNLDEAADATRTFAAAIREIAERSHAALKVVESVGGPEILRRLQQIEGKQAQQFAEIQEQARSLAEKTLLSVDAPGIINQIQGVSKKMDFEVGNVSKKLNWAIGLAGAATLLAAIAVFLGVVN